MSTLLHDAVNFTKFIDITAKSKVGESINTFSSSVEKIKALETELKSIKQPEEPLSAQRLFENKFFNQVKQKMPHLPSKDIFELIQSKWKHGISDAEREEFNSLSEQARKKFF